MARHLRQGHIKKLFIKVMTKRYIVFTILSILLSFLVLVICWIVTISNIPDPKVYLYEYFDNGLERWEAFDAELVPNDFGEKSDNVVKLSSKKYMAPHLKYNFTNEEIPPDSFVLQFQIRISNFTNEAMTLGSINFPIQPIILVVNQDERIGVAQQIFAEPVYASSMKEDLEKDKWYNISIRVDGKKHLFVVYIDDKKVLSQSYTELTYPLHEIWLGTIWVKGAGNYGIPIDIRYNNLTIGNEGLIPKPSLPRYSINLFNSFIDWIRSKI